MANEISVTLSLSGYKPAVMSSAQGRSVTGRTFTMTGNFVIGGTINALTTGTIIPLGSITTPHWAWFENVDLTNFITLRNGASGADFPKLYPGEIAVVPLIETGDFRAVADTATAKLEYLIFSL